MVSWHDRLVSMILLSLLLVAGLSRADDSEESRVKAAFVYNFTKFVEWPAAAFEHASSPFRLCLSGAPATAFSALSEYQAQGRPIEVVTIAADSSDAALACHLHYQAGGGADAAAADISAPMPVLTVTDNLSRPRMITLFLQGEHVRFAVDQQALTQAGLRASARLLSLAQQLPGGGSR